jgi:methylglutamate dehydrogenase subunit D
LIQKERGFMAKSAPVSKTPPSLTAQSPLGGYEMIADGTSLTEITSLSMVSVAPLAGSQVAFQTTMAKLFKIGRTSKTSSPRPSVTMALDWSGKPRCILMPSAQNQWFLCFDDDGTDPIDAAKALLGQRLSKQMAMTDQSDSWVILALSGLHSRQTLARICPIDCSESAMPIGTTARTSMEHLGAIITRRPDEGDHQPCFWLLSARSSAASFLHAITGSPPFRN